MLTGEDAIAAPPEGKGSEPKDAEKEGRVDGKPVLTPIWKKTTLGLPPEEDFQAEQFKPVQEWVSEQFKEVVKRRQATGRPLIPPAVPVGIGHVVAYMTERSVAARYLTHMVVEDQVFMRGELAWESQTDNSLVFMSRDSKTRTMTADWFKRYKADSITNAFFERTLSAAISAGTGEVCAVDEAGLLPPEELVRAGYGFGPLEYVVKSNSLRLIDLQSGKIKIKLPDDIRAPRPARARPTRFWLGASLNDGGLWYSVYEQEKSPLSLRLQCIDFDKYLTLLQTGVGEWEAASTLWDTEVWQATVPLFEDVSRRLHAVPLIKSGGLIICPTNLGRIAAVAAETGKVAWTYDYSAPRFRALPSSLSDWVVVRPVVAQDRYIYAPVGFSELLCLNVADGKKVWSAKKGDGLYPAVVGEQVLVIGEKSVRSLNLKDGSELWKLDLPGLPCGRGTLLGETYLVPISEPKTWRGMIAVVDLKAGKVTEVLKPEKDEPIGNLVVHKDFLISQTLTEIAVFPIRKKD